MSNLDLPGFYAQLPLAELRIDADYQRPLQIKNGSQYNPLRKGSPFEKYAVGVLSIAQRADGTYWIIDGQQRRELLRRQGYTHWHCLVSPSEGKAWEALWFMILNQHRLKVSRRHLFKSQLEAKDPHALALTKAAEDCGFKIAYEGGSGWPLLGSVGALYDAVRRWTAEPIRQALTILRAAFPGSKDAIYDCVLMGMVYFCWRYGKDIDQDRFIGLLQQKTALWLRQTTWEKATFRYARCARILAEIYNRRLRPKHRLKLIPIKGEADDFEGAGDEDSYKEAS